MSFDFGGSARSPQKGCDRALTASVGLALDFANASSILDCLGSGEVVQSVQHAARRRGCKRLLFGHIAGYHAMSRREAWEQSPPLVSNPVI